MIFEQKQFKVFALPFIISAVALMLLGACSDDTTPSLSYTDGDGIAELTTVPGLPSTLTTSDTTVAVNISVDADTTAVEVWLRPVGDSEVSTHYVNNVSVTASAENAIAMSTGATSVVAGTKYYIELVTCNSGTTCQTTLNFPNFDANDLGYVDADPTSGLYQKLGFSPLSETNTGVSIPTVTAE